MFVMVNLHLITIYWCFVLFMYLFLHYLYNLFLVFYWFKFFVFYSFYLWIIHLDIHFKMKSCRCMAIIQGMLKGQQQMEHLELILIRLVKTFIVHLTFFFLIYMSSLSYELKWDIIIFNNKGEIFILYLFFLFGCVYIIVVADNTGPLFKERHVQTI